MPSFDVVSEIDTQEIDNAVNQAMKEIGQRYDFRGSKCTLKFDEKDIKLEADDDYKATAVLDILRTKCAKRGIDLKSLDIGKFDQASGGSVRCTIGLKQGIPTDEAKKINKAIKERKLKVQSQIQGDQLRVTGKKRDDLQDVIAFLKEESFDLPLQFTNFRD